MDTIRRDLIVNALEASGAEELPVGEDGVEHWKGVPQQTGLVLSLLPLEDGLVEVQLSSPHASFPAVMRNLGIRQPPPGVIRKHTPTTAGYVVSEPHRPQPSGGGAGVERTYQGERPPSEERFVSSEPVQRRPDRGTTISETAPPTAGEGGR